MTNWASVIPPNLCGAAGLDLRLLIVSLGLARLLSAVAAPLLALVVLSAVPAAASTADVEDYASYEAPKRCHTKPKPGTVLLGRWVARQYGGGWVGYGRACSKKDGPTSEHQTGQAFDWALDARNRRDQRTADRLMERLFAADRRGNEDALARRMGVMYLIWDDQMFAAWNGFEPERYLSSSCKTRRKCSPTLRHRDHVHVSLSRQGARGQTSWYDGRLS